MQDLGDLGDCISPGCGTPDSPLVRPFSDTAPIWAGTSLQYHKRPKDERNLAAPRNFAPAWATSSEGPQRGRPRRSLWPLPRLSASAVGLVLGAARRLSMDLPTCPALWLRYGQENALGRCGSASPLFRARFAPRRCSQIDTHATQPQRL